MLTRKQVSTFEAVSALNRQLGPGVKDQRLRCIQAGGETACSSGWTGPPTQTASVCSAPTWERFTANRKFLISASLRPELLLLETAKSSQPSDGRSLCCFILSLISYFE